MNNKKAPQMRSLCFKKPFYQETGYQEPLVIGLSR
ncbi:hypothetical protein VCE7224_04111 [Vibrio celticus]|uniref:Uncharacterized protein n=1 Tax=Vibrio celticus TaxID=446372 RepID=A0A1C3JJM1_9VIBR|nr:hypothetical protein VCE7224_04111 [Vibrio celticus]